eukprot:1382297-Rhodomonas_salina.1
MQPCHPSQRVRERRRGAGTNIPMVSTKDPVSSRTAIRQYSTWRWQQRSSVTHMSIPNIA